MFILRDAEEDEDLWIEWEEGTTFIIPAELLDDIGNEYVIEIVIFGSDEYIDGSFASYKPIICVGGPDFRLPAGTAVISEEAFAGINAEVLILPDNLTTIESGAFADCTDLRKSVFGSQVAFIASDAFDGCNIIRIKLTEDNDYVMQ